MCGVVFSSSLIKRVWGRMGAWGEGNPFTRQLKGFPSPQPDTVRRGEAGAAVCDGGHRRGVKKDGQSGEDVGKRRNVPCCRVAAARRCC